ncbi:MAG: LysM peptidoglycan-binding domain-containing protein [Heliobacteriaceae bacterium]|jgi:hypothetical protein|nr:LysM peptidoglycan-binding domain-containing protein [Heliobacteriaceae bacterium]
MVNGVSTNPNQQYTVQKGDSLWKICRDRMPKASDTEVANMVRKLAKENRLQIDDNGKCMIKPGQELTTSIFDSKPSQPVPSAPANTQTQALKQTFTRDQEMLTDAAPPDFGAATTADFDAKIKNAMTEEDLSAIADSLKTANLSNDVQTDITASIDRKRQEIQTKNQQQQDILSIRTQINEATDVEQLNAISLDGVSDSVQLDILKGTIEKRANELGSAGTLPASDDTAAKGAEGSTEKVERYEGSSCVATEITPSQDGNTREVKTFQDGTIEEYTENPQNGTYNQVIKYTNGIVKSVDKFANGDIREYTKNTDGTYKHVQKETNGRISEYTTNIDGSYKIVTTLADKTCVTREVTPYPDDTYKAIITDTSKGTTEEVITYPGGGYKSVTTFKDGYSIEVTENEDGTHRKQIQGYADSAEKRIEETTKNKDGSSQTTINYIDGRKRTIDVDADGNTTIKKEWYGNTSEKSISKDGSSREIIKWHDDTRHEITEDKNGNTTTIRRGTDGSYSKVITDKEGNLVNSTNVDDSITETATNSQAAQGSEVKSDNIAAASDNSVQTANDQKVATGEKYSGLYKLNDDGTLDIKNSTSFGANLQFEEFFIGKPKQRISDGQFRYGRAKATSSDLDTARQKARMEAKEICTRVAIHKDLIAKQNSGGSLTPAEQKFMDAFPGYINQYQLKLDANGNLTSAV